MNRKSKKHCSRAFAAAVGAAVFCSSHGAAESRSPSPQPPAPTHHQAHPAGRATDLSAKRDVRLKALDPKDFQIKAAKASYQKDLDQYVFSMDVEGEAGKSIVQAAGSMSGAPVLAYVFPTTLKPEAAGFSSTEGILALVAAQHPDFDDSPYFDENRDGNPNNDGATWHTHWVVLMKDSRVKGGLAVKEFKDAKGVVLPPTAPKMAMYMDSPGHPVVLRGSALHVIVPGYRLQASGGFKFDAVTCYLEVSHDSNLPMLGVYEVFNILSKDLSLPFALQK